MVQLTGSRSITAAAEFSVTFGQCFYRLEARLLGVRGSSSAQGMAYAGTFPDSRRGGTPGRPSVPPLRVERNNRVIGAGPLIRLAWRPATYPQGKALRAVSDPPLRRDRGAAALFL